LLSVRLWLTYLPWTAIAGREEVGLRVPVVIRAEMGPQVLGGIREEVGPQALGVIQEAADPTARADQAATAQWSSDPS